MNKEKQEAISSILDEAREEIMATLGLNKKDATLEVKKALRNLAGK